MIQEVKRIKETVESKDEEIRQLRAQLQVYQSQDNQQNTTLVQQLRVSTEWIFSSFFIRRRALLLCRLVRDEGL